MRWEGYSPPPGQEKQELRVRHRVYGAQKLVGDRKVYIVQVISRPGPSPQWSTYRKWYENGDSSLQGMSGASKSSSPGTSSSRMSC